MSPMPAAKASTPCDLTDTELQVLRLLAQGPGDAAIADQMAVSENTVKTHVNNLLAKLGGPNWALAATLAIRQRYGR